MNTSMKPLTITKAGTATRMTFPFQLHELLSEASELGLDDIITWQPLGDSFIILKPNEFAQKIMPKVFRQTKFSSFKRQLNAYGFLRAPTESLDLIVYSNAEFRRDQPEACGQILRRRPGPGPLQPSEPPEPTTSKHRLCISVNQLQLDEDDDDDHDEQSPNQYNSHNLNHEHDDHVLDEMVASLDCYDEEVFTGRWDTNFEAFFNL
jgi:hypothetical protein